MKKWILSVTLVGSLIGLSACSGGGGETIVKTKAGDVTKDELYEMMKDRVGEQFLQQIVLEKVLSKDYDVKDNEVNDRLQEIKDEIGPQFEMQLMNAGFKDEEEFKESLRLSMMQEKAAMKDVEVSEDEVKDYYDHEEPAIDVSHIIVEDEDTAKEIKSKLDAGEDFADLAKEYSMDGTKETGGELGTIGKDDERWDADFREAAYKLKENEISAPVQTSFGWHIIKVNKKPEKQPFDKVKDEYTTKLKLAKLDRDMVDQATKKELKDAKIDVKDKDLKSAFDLMLAEDQVEPAPTPSEDDVQPEEPNQEKDEKEAK